MIKKVTTHTGLTLFPVLFLLMAGSSNVAAQDIRSALTKRAAVTIPLSRESSGSATPMAIDTTSLGNRILSAMNTLYAKTLSFNMHGVSASIYVPGFGQWNGTVGINYGSEPMDTSLLCEAGSITKTFVAALIMRLQDQGKLSINDSIYKWLPRRYPNVDSAITIEMLLNHSSGIYDYTNDDTDQTVLYDQYELEPGKVWTADTILLNYVKAPNFKPGTNYQYSNTNYILLGVIAQQVGGASLRDLIHNNFIDPLQLSHTFVGGADSIPYPFAHNWSAADSKYPSTDLSFIDKTAQLTGSPGDGNICSTPSDLIKWVRTLYTGSVVSADALKQMKTVHRLDDSSYYGLGTERVPYYSETFYGHSGSMVGFQSSAYVNPKDSVTIALYVNWDPDPLISDVYLNDYTVAILNEIYKSASTVSPPVGDALTSATAYPNPASGMVTISFALDNAAPASLKIYDQLGAEVRSVPQRLFEVGRNELSIDISTLRSGAYFYLVQTDKEIQTGKLFVK